MDHAGRRRASRDAFRQCRDGRAGASLSRRDLSLDDLAHTRLDTTTNWAVVTLGIALSISFSSPSASPLPLVLVGVLILFFLWLEARRYRYFNVWRARARWLENNFYAPMLKDGDLKLGNGWPHTLAEDYLHPGLSRRHVDSARPAHPPQLSVDPADPVGGLSRQADRPSNGRSTSDLRNCGAGRYRPAPR